MAADDVWQQRAAALRLVHGDFPLLHGMVMDEIGHPLPPDMGDFVRDWLDTAARAVEKNVSGLPWTGGPLDRRPAEPDPGP